MIWIGGIIGVAVAAVVLLPLEREQVARRNYKAARAGTRVARSVWLVALRRAALVLTIPALLLAIAYLISTGRS